MGWATVFLLLFRWNLHETISWRAIVRALPLSLHFDAELRRRPAEPRILARQRTVAGFRQHQALNRSFFVGGGVRRRIRVTARQPISRTFGPIRLLFQFLSFSSFF